MYDNEEIAQMLAVHRPDRYVAGALEWADPVLDAIADSISAGEAKERTALAVVRDVERTATRRGNGLLKHYKSNLQGAFDFGGWMTSAVEASRQPVAVGKERVCFEDLTAEDLRQFALDERIAATQDYSARLASCDGAERLADDLNACGARTIRDLLVKS